MTDESKATPEAPRATGPAVAVLPAPSAPPRPSLAALRKLAADAAATAAAAAKVVPPSAPKPEPPPSVPDETLDKAINLIADLGLNIKQAAGRLYMEPNKLRPALYKRRAEELKLAVRERAAELMEEALAIADDSTGDTIEKTSRKGNTYTSTDYENIARSKLRAETRMRMAALLDPEKWGPKQKLEHSGAINFNVTSSLLND